MSFNLTIVRNDLNILCCSLYHLRIMENLSFRMDTIIASAHPNSKLARFKRSSHLSAKLLDCIWVRIFEFQINDQYVVRLDTSRDLARFSPAIIEACRRRLCCRCRMLFMRLYGKGDAASGDAVAALLGMHRSRHGGEWRRDRARDSQPALLTSER